MCIPWIVEQNGCMQFVDPIDNIEISTHYGATHAAVALIIFGREKGVDKYRKLGESLLRNVLMRWDSVKELADFHNDFNNFALCVLDYYTQEYHDSICETVLSTEDSNHDTINWLPMRWFVNLCRFNWTGNNSYITICENCEKKIQAATYSDGYIDDRLPLGYSFNLQYNVATVGVMQFMRVIGEELDISKEVGALLNSVCPDGDINYIGRGTNQIFAWGPWIYLLASAELSELDRALSYLEERLPSTLKNHNIMLNDYAGEEKYLWWDYHYCSVYTAHILLWLVLAWRDTGKRTINPNLIINDSSGIQIHRTPSAFISVFNGRSGYLCERGPQIGAIWTINHGTMYKGSFGPWGKPFGERYNTHDVVLKNHLGLMDYRRVLPFIERRYFPVAGCSSWKTTRSVVKPVFHKLSVAIEDNIIRIQWLNDQAHYLQIPMPYSPKEIASILKTDSKAVFLYQIRNQYQDVNVYVTQNANKRSAIEISV